MISRLAVETSRFTEAEKWARKAVDGNVTPASIAQSLQQYGYCQIKLGNLTEALRWYERAEVVCREHRLDRTLAYVLHDTGIIYQTLSQFDKAISLYEESIPLSRSDGDIRHVMFSFHQMGTASYDLGKFKEASEYHLKAMDLAAVTGDYSQISNSEHELGMLDFLSGRLVSSINRFRRGINIAHKTGRLEYLAVDLQHIGITLMEVEKTRPAERFLLKAKQAYEDIGDDFTLSELQAYLSQCYLLTGDTGKASDAAQAGIELAQRENAQEYLTRCCFMAGVAAYLAGDWASGGNQIHHSIIVARDERFIALLLDEIYLCARFELNQLTFDGLDGLTSWAISIYKELGNEWRRSRIQSFQTALKQ
jgi:tetratricopeptide (TPR) repeat protein